MPTRSVTHPGGYVVGHFPSLKVKRMVAFQSILARDYLYVLDYSLQVLSYQEQPFTITYQHNCKPRRFTPDFLVSTSQAVTLTVCAAQACVDDEENIARFEATRAWSTANGFLFQIVTDQQVHAGYTLSNIKLLTRYARHRVSADFHARVFQLLSMLPSPVSLTDLARAVDAANPSIAASNILHLIFHHILTLDLDRAPIGGTSVLRLPDITDPRTGLE